MTTMRLRVLAGLTMLMVLSCGDSSSPSADGSGSADAGTDGNGVLCLPTASVREEITQAESGSPRVAVDGLGGVHVVYTVLDVAEYAHRDPITGEWTRVQVFDSGSEWLDVAADARGAVHVVTSGTWLIHAFREPGGEWQYDEVDIPSLFPSVALDEEGGLYVCAQDGALGCGYRSPDGIWDAGVVPVGATVNGKVAVAVGPEGVGHVLFGAYEFGVWVRIGHAWQAASGGEWETEWVTEELASENHHAYGIDLVVDADGVLHGAWSDGIKSMTPTFDRWSRVLRYVRKAPGSAWTSQVLLSDADEPSPFLRPDGGLGMVFSPHLPYRAGHDLRLAHLTGGSWYEEEFACGVAGVPNVAVDDCCVHVVNWALDADGDYPFPLVYQRYCPEAPPTLPLGEGSCLDVCRSEVAACEAAWCDGDTNPISSCERTAMIRFPGCTSYDMTDGDCVGPASCSGIQDEWSDLVNCIRDNCYSPCE